MKKVNYFGGVKKFWNRWGYTVLIVVTLLIFGWMYFFHKKEKGESDSTTQFIFVNNKESPKKKRTPTKSKGEIECKAVMESIFGVPFVKIRPDWLMNEETGKNLEIDVYNPDLKIAVEYNGSQHYHFNKYFHKSELDFAKQLQRDEDKRRKCKDKGVLLIEVPYTIDNEKIREFLIHQLKKNGKI